MAQAEITILTDFVPRLRACRKQMGLTQAQFAELAGVGLGAQNRYEAGATEPSASYLARLSDAGVDVVHLLTGRRSSDSLDADTTEVVDAIGHLTTEQRCSLIVFLRTLTSTTKSD